VADAPAQLEYAHTPPWHRTRRARQIVVAAVLVGLVIAIWMIWPAVSLRTQLLYWQRKCLNHTSPADGIVFHNDAKVASVSSDWDDFYALLSPPGKSKTDATIYLGKMINADGKTVLVSLELADQDLMGRYDIVWNIVEIGGISQPPKLLNSGRVIFAAELTHGGAFYGQLDPDAPSHLVLRFESPGIARIKDVWLRSENMLKIEERRPETSVTPPSP